MISLLASDSENTRFLVTSSLPKSLTEMMLTRTRITSTIAIRRSVCDLRDRLFIACLPFPSFERDCRQQEGESQQRDEVDDVARIDHSPGDIGEVVVDR